MRTLLIKGFFCVRMSMDWVTERRLTVVDWMDQNAKERHLRSTSQTAQKNDLFYWYCEKNVGSEGHLTVCPQKCLSDFDLHIQNVGNYGTGFGIAMVQNTYVKKENG